MDRETGAQSALGPKWTEKPQNGFAGLKHWRHDLPAGLMVAMISLPFSMGIAITSGAPPVCGIVSAVIAGFLLPFLGGSYVTISGPAAGLAPVLYAGVLSLGNGDLAKGYPLVLVAICLAGLLQMVLARLKIARFSAMFPAAAVEGMLAAIGLMIIVKQIPYFMGLNFHTHEFWEVLREVPEHVNEMNVQVFGLGVGCLTALFILSSIRIRLFKVMPAAVWVFFGGTVITRLFFNLDAKYLIHVPEAPLANGIVFPDFVGAFSDVQLLAPLSVCVVTLLLIDGVESLATIAAVDKIDPFRRKSDPDRTLLAMGASNLCSSVLGGLTIIPGIVKSTANILGGGRTQWANFYNACFLLVILILGRDLINMVPTCVLAAILVYVGYKLCRPKVWRHMAHIGTEQFLVFAMTIFVTVSTDLLLGIAAGVALKLAIGLWYVIMDSSADDERRSTWEKAASLFCNPVDRREYSEGIYSLHFARPLVSFNLFHLYRELDRAPKDARTVKLHVSNVRLIDHTTCENLMQMVEDSDPGSGRATFSVEGFDRLHCTSKSESGIRRALAGGKSANAAIAAETPAAARSAMEAPAPDKCSTEAHPAFKAPLG